MFDLVIIIIKLSMDLFILFKLKEKLIHLKYFNLLIIFLIREISHSKVIISILFIILIQLNTFSPNIQIFKCIHLSLLYIISIIKIN